MSSMTHPITELIKQRYSSRAYVKAPLAPEQAGSLASCAAAVRAGPLGTPLRFTLVAAAAGDSRTLRGLGTYGLIKNPAGFLYDPAFWQPRHFIFFDYACRSDETDVRLNDEAQEYVWAPVDEALHLPVEPYTEQAIRTYLAQQTGR